MMAQGAGKQLEWASKAYVERGGAEIAEILSSTEPSNQTYSLWVTTFDL